MDKLPKVYANPIDHNINNEQKYFSSEKIVSNNRANKSESIEKEIDNILNSTRHIYRSKVKIYFNNTEREAIIVSRNDKYLITIDNEKIPLSKIDRVEVI